MKNMLPSPAQYLLRFDDLCPTIPRQCWQRFLPLIDEFHLRPILAIIPDNRDPSLCLAPPDPGFWEAMRALEAAGATMALHGYQHLCAAAGRSLVPLSRQSEFAGVPEPTQRAWIREGLGILRGHGLTPRIWVAPRHGFDKQTLRALRAEGIAALSDGVARKPFMRCGLVWIPQQLWAPQQKDRGLWTICIHPHTAKEEDLRDYAHFSARTRRGSPPSTAFSRSFIPGRSAYANPPVPILLFGAYVPAAFGIACTGALDCAEDAQSLASSSPSPSATLPGSGDNSR